MSERMLNVTFSHPFKAETKVMPLPADTRFLDVTKILYKDGFLEKKKGDYQYIIDGRLCSLSEKLETYAYDGDNLNVRVHGLLTILA